MNRMDNGAERRVGAVRPIAFFHTRRPRASRRVDMQIASVRHTYERPARLAGILIALLLLVSNSLVASAPGSADRIDALLARYRELGLFSGSALVADQGQVVLKKG